MKNIILASKSPRRIEMLGKYVKNIIVCPSDTKEIVNENDFPKITVMKIALAKALAVGEKCSDKGIIISADTVVYLDRIMGKPQNYTEGYEMLKLLSGKIHSVFTGVCIIDSENNKRIVDYEETTVEFNELTDDLIIKYLDTGEFKDKAGAYGIQGYGELFVKAIHGCYNNVKGLPLTKLNNLLTKHFSLNLL
jgi:septum formation protein